MFVKKSLLNPPFSSLLFGVLSGHPQLHPNTNRLGVTRPIHCQLLQNPFTLISSHTNTLRAIQHGTRRCVCSPAGYRYGASISHYHHFGRCLLPGRHLLRRKALLRVTVGWQRRSANLVLNDPTGGDDGGITKINNQRGIRVGKTIGNKDFHL